LLKQLPTPFSTLCILIHGYYIISIIFLYVAVWVLLLHSHIQLVPELSLGGRLGGDSRQDEFEQGLREDTCMQNLISSGVVLNGNGSLLTQARRRLYGSMKESSNTMKNAIPGENRGVRLNVL
jgi:hypothetical protein